jgi:hypothetical protein
MTFVEEGQIKDAINATKWLIKHQNFNGGFYTIRETLIGLQALGKLSLAIHKDYKTFRVDIGGISMSVDSHNEIKKKDFERGKHRIYAEVHGSGLGVIHLRAKKQFEENVKTDAMKLTFESKETNQTIAMKNIMDLTICPTYNQNFAQRNEIVSKYGVDIIVVEVVLPSGYFFDTETLANYKSFAFIEVGNFIYI